MEYSSDILIVGGGVIGCAVARELSRYEASITLLERGGDVAEGSSKANSGIVHAGYDAVPGTLKAKYNVLGANMLPDIFEVPSLRFTNITGTSAILKPSLWAVYFISIWNP